jgi:hypothetical protein
MWNTRTVPRLINIPHDLRVDVIRFLRQNLFLLREIPLTDTLDFPEDYHLMLEAMVFGQMPASHHLR